jgi:hypothetical protein
MASGTRRGPRRCALEDRDLRGVRGSLRGTGVGCSGGNESGEIVDPKRLFERQQDVDSMDDLIAYVAAQK